MNNFTIEEIEEDTRLDNYLKELFSDFSRAKLQKSIENGEVKVNGEVKKSSYKLRADDKIEVDLKQEEAICILPQPIDLDIVYEDENMLVVNKPSGMLTHPTTLERENTLVNALLYKYGENLSDINGEFRRGILHRLDRNTSGLLMVAKNNQAHEFLSNQIRAKTAVRKYLAVAKGSFEKDFFAIDKPIGRHKSAPKMAVVQGAKSSVTEVRVLEGFRDCTYIELTLKTGRTHQIRVHLSDMNRPILNDTLYGAGQFKVKTQEQVLQAYKLSFTKPFSDEIIELEIEPDEKVQKVINYLRTRK